jgi:DNA-binding transcriptional LysR family regulator
MGAILLVLLKWHAMAILNLLRRLDPTTLQLFLAIQEEGTLTRAAEREAIAVSAASKRLVDLEQALGVALFVRKARGMELTPAGATLLTHARRMLLSVEKIGIELAEHALGVRGYVRWTWRSAPATA